jgi:hypothetical protein
MVRSVCLWIIVAVFFSRAALAQPAMEWQRWYGDSTHTGSWYGVEASDDGGYVMAGQIAVPPDQHGVAVTKLNAQGDTVWTRAWFNLHFTAWSLCKAPHGGFAVGGNAYNPESQGAEIGIIRIDSTGQMLWNRAYDGAGSAYDQKVNSAPDGGFIGCGSVTDSSTYHSLLHIVRVDSLGDTLWTGTYGSNYGMHHHGENAVVTRDGGAIAVGFENPMNGEIQNFYAVKVDSQGAFQWEARPVSGGWGVCETVIESSDGGYVMVGERAVGSGPYQIHVIKLDTAGQTVWTRVITNPRDGDARTIREMPDGGFVLAGATMNGTNSADFLLLRLDHSGNVIYTRSYGTTAHENAQSFCFTADGGYLMSGWSGDLFYAVKTVPDSCRRIDIIHPNGGERFIAGVPDSVSWSSFGFTGGVRVEWTHNFYSEPWQTLLDSANANSAALITLHGTASDHCRLRISALHANVSDTSDADFSVLYAQSNLSLVQHQDQDVQLYQWDFGTLECPQTAQLLCRLHNMGNATVWATGLHLIHHQAFSLAENCLDTVWISSGEVASCVLSLTFRSQGLGLQQDTLLVSTNAANVNGGVLQIPLVGSVSAIPRTPEVTIVREGSNGVRLRWTAVQSTVGGCDLDSVQYAIYHATTVDGEYTYLASTTEPTYLHSGAIQFGDHMFYTVVAYSGEASGQLPFLLKFCCPAPRPY